jgi:hypothetical protein
MVYDAIVVEHMPASYSGEYSSAAEQFRRNLWSEWRRNSRVETVLSTRSGCVACA